MSQAEGDFEAAVYASRFGGGSLNLFGTVSTKTSSNCPLMASRGFAAWGDTSPARRRGGAIKAGARKPRSNIDLNHFRQKSCLFWPLEPRPGKWLPDAHQRKEEPFPPQVTAFYVESCRDISGQEMI